MRLLGNVIWIVFGGFLSALGWILVFKIAKLSLAPFGANITREHYL